MTITQLTFTFWRDIGPFSSFAVAPNTSVIFFIKCISLSAAKNNYDTSSTLNVKFFNNSIFRSLYIIAS